MQATRSKPLQLREGVSPQGAPLTLAEGNPPPPSVPHLRGVGAAGGGSVQAGTAPAASGINWWAFLGGYAGALALGTLVGWLAGGKRGVVPGAAATSFLWSTGEAVWHWRERNWGASVGLLALSAPSAVVAFRKRRKG